MVFTSSVLALFLTLNFIWCRLQDPFFNIFNHYIIKYKLHVWPLHCCCFASTGSDPRYRQNCTDSTRCWIPRTCWSMLTCFFIRDDFLSHHIPEVLCWDEIWWLWSWRDGPDIAAMPSASSFVMCIHRCSFAYLKAAWPLSSDIIEVFSPADFLPQAVRCKTVLQENASGLEICVDEQVYLIKCHFVIIAALRAPRQRFLLLHSVNKVFQQSRIRWY